MAEFLIKTEENAVVSLQARRVALENGFVVFYNENDSVLCIYQLQRGEMVVSEESKLHLVDLDHAKFDAGPKLYDLLQEWRQSLSERNESDLTDVEMDFLNRVDAAMREAEGKPPLVKVEV